jgi:protein SCO1/2
MMRLFFAFVLVAMIGGYAESRIERASFDGAVTAHRLAGVVLVDQRAAPYRFDLIPPNGAIIVQGYTHCADRCPATLTRISAQFAHIPPSRRPRVVFLSIDPVHDTPAELRAFLAMWSLPIVGLTGTPENVARAVTSLGAVMPVAPRIAFHDARIAFVRPDGVIRVMLEPEADDGSMTAPIPR